MNQIASEHIAAEYVFTAFWAVVIVVMVVIGRYIHAISRFREHVLNYWKPALVIALLYNLSMGFGGYGWLHPYTLAVFCQGMIGLAIASGIQGFIPLPVTHAISERRQVLRQVGIMFAVALLSVIPAILIGSLGQSIARQVFREADYTQQAISALLRTNKWLAFFTLLGGAGIAEETTFRLVCLSLVWKVTHRSWLAIVISSLLFGAYHLTPLDSMYRIFWQNPISQFIGVALSSLVMGYLFVKRGYGAAVLGHTLIDWLPMMIFT